MTCPKALQGQCHESGEGRVVRADKPWWNLTKYTAQERGLLAGIFFLVLLFGPRILVLLLAFFERAIVASGLIIEAALINIFIATFKWVRALCFSWSVVPTVFHGLSCHWLSMVCRANCFSWSVVPIVLHGQEAFSAVHAMLWVANWLFRARRREHRYCGSRQCIIIMDSDSEECCCSAFQLLSELRGLHLYLFCPPFPLFVFLYG